MELIKVIHLYMGCRIKTHPEFEPNRREQTETKGICNLTPDLLADLLNGTFPGQLGFIWKPILRRLESITDEEWSLFEPALGYDDLKDEFLKNACNYEWSVINEALIFFRENAIDVDGLIDSGQAIDAATISNEK